MGLFQTLSDQSRSCFRHSPRSHIRGCLWNSEPDSHANSHIALGQFFWFSGKHVCGQKIVTEEGTGVTSDVVKEGPLKGEDPVTPGPLP